MNIFSPKWSVFFSLGFFSILAQAVIFRHFLAAIAMNELAIGLFFASWLAWVGIGSIMGRRNTWLAQWAGERLTWLALLYGPAAVVQFALLSHLRDWMGTPVYAALPFSHMVIIAAVGNGLVSFCTGFLFAISCRVLSSFDSARTAVNAVYAWEALGGFAGGCSATLLPVLRAADETCLFAGWALLAVVAVANTNASAARRLATGFVALAALALLGAFAQGWRASNDLAFWQRILPAAQFRGAFRTPHGRYVWGVREEQHIVLHGRSEIEALPDSEGASRTAALHLAQKPDAKRVLIIGVGGLALAARFADIAGIETITWLHPDPAYPDALGQAVPAARQALARITAPAVEPRQYLLSTSEHFDLIILHLSEIDSLGASRFATAEFLRLAKRVLLADGVLSWRISGGENYLGPELAWLGASAIATLQAVFPHFVLKPGAETWLFASEHAAISEDAEILGQRYASVPEAEKIYPAAALAGLYNKERIRFQRDAYAKARQTLPGQRLISVDQHPTALLYSLCVAWRRYDIFQGSAWAALGERSIWLAASMLILYFACRRLLLGMASNSRTKWGKADACLLTLLGGLASMAAAILLMFRLETYFGSLFLLVGLVSSLFLLGSALAAFAVERILQKGANASRILALLVAAHIAFIIIAARTPSSWGEAWHALLFLVCGFLGGVYFPLASHWLAQSGENAQNAGGWLEASDHLGAALGAFGGSAILLPLFGVSGCAIAIALALVACLAPYIAPAGEMPITPGKRLCRAIAALALAACGLAVLSAPLWAQNAARLDDNQQDLLAAVHRLSPEEDITAAKALLPDGTRFTYWRTAAAACRYIFPTAPLAPEAIGFGGPLHLLVCVENNGRLRGFALLRHNEDEAYLEKTLAWQHALIGRNIFNADDLAGVDTVTGATCTSAAILAALRLAGNRFAAHVLGRNAAAASQEGASAPYAGFALIALFALASVFAAVLRFYPRMRGRWLFFAAMAAVFGWWANLQFSSTHVVLLLSGDIAAGLAGIFCLAVVISAFLVGNLYCGYLCPFGAFQEILSLLSPHALRSEPEKSLYGVARLVKYGFIFLLAYALLTGSGMRLAAEPLNGFFSGASASGLALAALALSLFYRRFWCRVLCPAGAFLTFVGSAAILRRWLPAVIPERCDIGVRHSGEIDCLHCDRCRLNSQVATSVMPARLRAFSFVLSLLLCGFVFGKALFIAPSPPSPDVSTAASAATRTSAGKPRHIDISAFRRLLENSRLSDRPAEYQRPIGEETEKQ